MTKQQNRFNFTLFYNYYKQMYPENVLPSSQWLTWFIGFSEGDGCFMKTNRGDLMFVIVQSTDDVAILIEIANTLGFGSVRTQTKTACRFIVQDQRHSALIIYLFNGNLVLPGRIKQFRENYYNPYHELIKKKRKRQAIRSVPEIHEIHTPVLPTLKDFWLSGFTDSEGCFSCSISNRGHFVFSYSLAQSKEINISILKHIRNLFGHGRLYTSKLKKKNDCWADSTYFFVTGIAQSKIVVGYFTKFPLKSKKRLSFEKWCEVRRAVEQKRHLIPEKRQKLATLLKKINPKIDHFALEQNYNSVQKSLKDLNQKHSLKKEKSKIKRKNKIN